MTKPLVPVFLILSVSFLSAGWLQLGIWPVAPILVLLLIAGLWLRSKQKLPAMLNLALFLLVGLTAFGLWRGLDLSLAIVAVLSVLVAWDLEYFSQRLAFASADDGAQLLERDHLLQLGLILSLGLGLSLASLSIHIVSSFEWAVVLAVITFAGIGALVNRLWNREK